MERRGTPARLEELIDRLRRRERLEVGESCIPVADVTDREKGGWEEVVAAVLAVRGGNGGMERTEGG